MPGPKAGGGMREGAIPEPARTAGTGARPLCSNASSQSHTVPPTIPAHRPRATHDLSLVVSARGRIIGHGFVGRKGSEWRDAEVRDLPTTAPKERARQEAHSVLRGGRHKHGPLPAPIPKSPRTSSATGTLELGEWAVRAGNWVRGGGSERGGEGAIFVLGAGSAIFGVLRRFPIEWCKSILCACHLVRFSF